MNVTSPLIVNHNPLHSFFILVMATATLFHSNNLFVVRLGVFVKFKNLSEVFIFYTECILPSSVLNIHLVLFSVHTELGNF